MMHGQKKHKNTVQCSGISKKR